MYTGIINIIKKTITNENIIKIYQDGLKITLPLGTSTGLIVGLCKCYSDKEIINHSHKYFTNIIGYTTIGMVSGVTYPISFPIISVYAMITNNKNKLLEFPK